MSIESDAIRPPSQSSLTETILEANREIPKGTHAETERVSSSPVSANALDDIFATLDEESDLACGTATDVC